jgi:DNA-binding MarR family transcriptional regulator
MNIDIFARKFEDLLPDISREFIKRQENALIKGVISLEQFLVMNYLYKKKASTMSDLSRYMSTTLSASTGMINRMVKIKLVTRLKDESDRRVVKIELTEKGRNMMEKIVCQRLRMIRNVFGRLSGDERKSYIDILEKMHNILISENA